MSPSIRFLPARPAILAGLLVAALVSASSIAHADRDKAKAFYDQAEKQYNLGKFDSAVDLYTKAYEEWPEPGFLFNIAQAYRQAGNCKQALFFYKRFLSLKASDPSKPIAAGLRTEVEARIAELDECVKRELANKPPDSNIGPDGNNNNPTTTTTPPGNTQVATRPPDGETEDGEAEEFVEPGGQQPGTIVVRAAAGGSQLVFPGLDKPALVPLQFGLALNAGYPVPVAAKVTLDFGASFHFMPIPLAVTQTDGSETTEIATMIGVLANAGAAVAFTDKFGLHLDLGLGLIHLGGLQKNDSLTDKMADSSNMFALRLAAALELALTPNIFATATPLSMTVGPAGSGLNEDANLAMRFDFLVGLGYKL